MTLDPLSAIGLAANIVQFIDFGRELVSDAKEIYHSVNGATAGNFELQCVAENISRLSSKLMKPLDFSQSAVSESEEEIVKIAASSRAIGEELITTIQRLRIGEGSHRKWQSVGQALNTVWKKDKIAKLQRRLEDARSNLSVHVLSYISLRQAQILRSLEHTRVECLEIDSARLQKIEPVLESLHNLVRSGQDLTGQHLALIDQKLRDSDHEATKFQKESSILKSLLFERMAARYSAIAEAHKNTFKWIFEPSRWPSSDPRSHLRFHDWLNSGDGIYWISGKPGSGKSTLVKFLLDCRQTKKCLQVWANGGRLAIAGFFFWIAGTDMQKSQRGLLQQLLFEIFKNFPDWIPIICQERWAISRDGFPAEWSLSELNEAFSKLSLTNANAGNSAKLCIFVDGLHEYNGDHLDLIKTIQNIAQINNVKVCVSSRPWNCFEDAFGRDALRKLYLQDLTKDDIALYVREKLAEVPSFSLMGQDVLQIEQVISETVRRAQGVFLWVYLVARSLRDGLINGDSLCLLYERLLEMPSDLEEFFDQLIRSVDRVYRKRMAHTFQVALETHTPLRLLLYSFIDEGGHILMRTSARNHWGSLQRDEEMLVVAVEETMNRQLNGRYKGLLESNGEPGVKEVDFLHRTVRDFLATKQMQDLLGSYSAHSFNASVCVCEAFIEQVKTFPGSLDLVHLDLFIEFAQRAEEEIRTPSTPLLDKMNDIFYSSDPILRDSLDIGSGRATSLLGKAIESCYISYVRDRLEREPHIFLGDDGQALMISLLTGLRCNTNADLREASYRMAEFLLENGANPNGMVYGKPILHALLDKPGVEGVGQRYSSSLKWYLRSLLLLLSRGAIFCQDLASKSCALWTYLLLGHDWERPLMGLVQHAYCLLFERGLNPNIVIEFGLEETRTLWGQLLSEFDLYPPHHLEFGLQMMELFLQKGADPYLVQGYPLGTLSVAEVSSAIFGRDSVLDLRFRTALEHVMESDRGHQRFARVQTENGSMYTTPEARDDLKLGNDCGRVPTIESVHDTCLSTSGDGQKSEVEDIGL